jgi:hypothetical protein
VTKKNEEAAADDFSAPTRSHTIASGRVVTFTSPDLFDLASGRIELPNQAKLDIWGLLLRGGDEDPAQQLLSDEKYIRSLYYSAQLVSTPRIRIDDEDADGVIDRREWSLPDLLAAFRFLRYGPPPAPARPEPPAAENPAPAGGGLSPEPE